MTQPKTMQSKETNFTVVDLFAGCGGFSLGFGSAGFHLKLAVEIDTWASDTLQFNHPESRVIKGDITQISDDIIYTLCPKRPDVIVGGPPCQGFSIAGPARKDPSDPRNSLFTYFAKWVGCLEPEVFVMENVKGLLARRNAQGISVAKIIEQTFKDLGYHVQLWVLNSAHYGVPQIRERIFFIGTRTAAKLSQPNPEFSLDVEEGVFDFESLPVRKALTLWDAISDLPELAAGEGEEDQPYSIAAQTEYQKWARGTQQRLFNHVAMSHSARLVERFKRIKWGESSADVPVEFGARARNGRGILSGASYDQNNRRLHPHKPSHTIAASFYANFVHPYQHRNLTAREGARLQSFPDSYRFMGKKTVVSHRLLSREQRLDERFLCQYNQIGNAVPPLLARAVALEVKKYLQHVRIKQQTCSRLQSFAERTA